VSRPTRGQYRFLPVRGCHPLWPDFPDGSGSYDTATGLVRVRSPLLTESRLMSFPPGTEMFQFPGFASPAYGFSWRYRLRGGLPHSEIPGSKPARGSPRLNAACHVLHRLSTPRHPPNALRSLACHPAPAARPAVPVGTARTRDRARDARAYPCQTRTADAPWPRRSRPVMPNAPAFTSSPLHHVIERSRTAASAATPSWRSRRNRLSTTDGWWARADSNGRPHPYQGCALTS
jgi:hypothetical protein